MKIMKEERLQRARPRWIAALDKPLEDWRDETHQSAEHRGTHV
jgi:hypothetical protein